MKMTVQVSTSLSAPSDRAWDLLLRKDTFLFITQGALDCLDADKWPARLFNLGAVLQTRIRLLGLGPAMPHEIHIVRLSEPELQIETREKGGLIRSWDHYMRIEPVSAVRCRYTDSIRIDAGLLTPLVWLFAAMFYRYRHRRWQKLLKLRIGSDE